MAQLKNTTISDTGFLQLPVGTTAQRPSPLSGYIRYNSSLNDVEFYNGTAWISANSAVPAATGGLISNTEDAGISYIVHTFRNSGTFTVTSPGEIEYLIVAGGGSGGVGSGGNAGGGAGGGGGVITGTAFLTAQNYTITVGAGGAGLVNNTANTQSSGGNQGQNSSAFGLTAIGGGRGRSAYGTNTTNASLGGGSGGGGSSDDRPTLRGDAVTGQGNIGAPGAAGGFGGGSGGGGAGSPGVSGTGGGSSSATHTAGPGGNGIASSISGSVVFYAGGGGGGHGVNGAGFALGGLGGGGRGGDPGAFQGSANSRPGAENSGGGSGGGSIRSGTGSSTENGGSGIVIIRYKRKTGALSAPSVALQATINQGTIHAHVPTGGLVLHLDAGDIYSYDPRLNQTQWRDLSPRNRPANILGTLNYSNLGGGSLFFPNDTTNMVQHTDFYNSNANGIFTGPAPSDGSNWGGNSTYEAWVFPTFNDGTNRKILTDNNFNEGEIRYISQRFSANWSSNSIINSANGNAVINRWYHVAMTHERLSSVENAYRLVQYLNGNLVGSTTAQTISGAAGFYGPDVRLVIGRQFGGYISVIRIYNRVLPNSLIKHNFEAERGRFGM